MNDNIKTIILIIFFALVFPNMLFSEILFKISGRAVHNGLGIKDIEIGCSEINFKLYKKIITGENGIFYVYVPNGEYRLNIYEGRQLGYVSSAIDKLVTVNGKNIANVVFFLEKECKISGVVKFINNNPIEDAFMQAFNSRGISMSNSDSNGNYLISGLRASDNSVVDAIIPGVGIQRIGNIALTEGLVLENINFIVPKNLSILGKVIDKDTRSIISDANIMVFDGKTNFPAAQNQDGNFLVYNLENKKYQIIIEHPIYKIVFKTISFSGEIINMEFEIEKINEL